MTDERRLRQRRDFIKAACAALSAPVLGLSVPLAAQQREVIKKSIPATGERLPVIGMGTSRTFDIGDEPQARARRLEVLQAFFDNGGAVIDSSPMYGSSEQVVGDLLQQVTGREGLFAATKVWAWGRQEGIDQMLRSMQRMRVKVFDLMQIHNLRDWQVHLETLRDWKQQGRIRYIGITTSHGRFHRELINILETEPFDFVQFSYSIGDREAEQRLLPLAAERGIATLVNRPFQRGELFAAVTGKALPSWAADIDCDSWAQIFLKFVVSHPAVTCTIPATSKASHMRDNMGANFGRLPDARLRRKMIAWFESA